MSYAGLKSLIYAGLKKDDERVKAVIGWLKKNYTLETNPKMGMQGLYYYYHGMAKALAAYGEDFLVDEQNVKHHWKKEFVERMLSIQSGEGYWANANNRWWENNKDLVTSYIVLALEEVTQ
jgi:squalene-hopene/tetraprenyl-beta-curcumene cyclase